jgi:hypothetical protein
MQVNPAQLSLPLSDEVFVIHCFFRGCSYITQSADPQEAHDLMERHYDEKHARQIDRIVGRVKRC